MTPEDSTQATGRTAEKAGAERDPAGAPADDTPADDAPTDDAPAAGRPRYAPPDSESFDWRGWFLVGVVGVCFLVVPGAILFLPQAEPALESLGLSLRDAYLALPMVPALVLGGVAVWSAVASRRSG